MSASACGLKSALPKLTEILRFLAVGILNTTLCYGGYLLLLHWLRYEIAYTIAYLAGIALSYVLNALIVFRQPLRRRAALRYPLVYIVQFLLGLVLLKVLIEFCGIANWLAPALVIVLTIPVTFLMSRAIVRAG